MQYRAVNVYLGPRKRLVGLLFQYGAGPNAITRLKPEMGYWGDASAPLLSLNARVQDAQERAVFLAEYISQPFFNGEGDKLPAAAPASGADREFGPRR
jgi:serine/threonine-protein kinase HipA